MLASDWLAGASVENAYALLIGRESGSSEIVSVRTGTQCSPSLPDLLRSRRFMAQQINCIRNAEGEVVEGSPGDIRAYFYVMAFQREYDDANHELVWKVVDFQLGGGEPYY